MPAAQTTLNGAIATVGATTCAVRDVLGFASASEADDLVQIGSELLLVEGGLGTTSWSSITRGYGGSTAATHLDGATVTRIQRGWTDLVRVRRALGFTNPADTTDDLYLLDLIDATNAEFDERVGIFLGPSTDTVRVYDGRDAVRGGTRLYIRGGIRTLTQVRIAESTGGTWHTETLSDFLLRPHAHELRSGEPYRCIDLSSSGSRRVLPQAEGNIELTGTFGRSVVAGNVAAIADMVIARMFNARDAGSLAAPSPSKFIFPDDARLLERLGSEHRARVGGS